MASKVAPTPPDAGAQSEFLDRGVINRDGSGFARVDANGDDRPVPRHQPRAEGQATRRRWRAQPWRWTRLGVIIAALTGIGFLLYLNAPSNAGQMPTFAVGWALAVFFGVRFLSGRLLGVRLGVFGSLVCAALGIAAGFGLQFAIVGNQGGAGPFALFAVLSLTGTMAFVALLGLAGRSKPETVEPGGTPHPLRALRMRMDRTARYLAILELTTRYGLGPLRTFRQSRDQRELGAALREGLQEAGGVFVKFGQFLSARTDLLPTAIALELSSLQDDVAPMPAQAVRDLIRSEFGPSADDLFNEFDERPLAAASIAQVHRARLPNGAEVIVKAQRPGIERLVERDLDILLRLVTSVADRDWARRLGAVALARAFADNLHEELDFRIEAQNIEAVAANEHALRTPHVYRDLSTRRVLVEEWIDGKPPRAAREELTPDLQKRLARSLLDAVLTQIVTSGVFHADPHAGNVLVDTEGRIALLDFGAVGRLDRLQIRAVTQALTAIARRNPALLRDALVDLSTASDDVIDEAQLERGLARFFVQRLGPGMQPGADILNDLLRLIVRLGLAVDPQLAAVFRSLSTLEGTLRLIDPTFNIVAEAQRFAEEHRLGLPRPAQVRDELLDDLLALVPALRRMPRRLDRISGALERGELTVRLRPFAHPRDRRLVVGLMNRLILAFIAGSIGLVSVFLLRLASGPIVFETHLDVLLGYGGLIAATILGLRVLVAITRDGG